MSNIVISYPDNTLDVYDGNRWQYIGHSNGQRGGPTLTLYPDDHELAMWLDEIEQVADHRENEDRRRAAQAGVL